MWCQKGKCASGPCNLQRITGWTVRFCWLILPQTNLKETFAGQNLIVGMLTLLLFCIAFFLTLFTHFDFANK